MVFTDHLISVYATKDPTGSGALIYYFYQGSKLVGQKIGRKMHNDHVFKVEGKPKKEKKKNNYSYRSSLSSSNYNIYQLQENDKVSHISEKKYWNNYVLKYRLYTASTKKTSFSNKKVTVVKRTLPSKEKILLFYQNKKLIGKKIGWQFTNYLK